MAETGVIGSQKENVLIDAGLSVLPHFGGKMASIRDCEFVPAGARREPRQNCVVLGPSTAPVDPLAIAGPWSRMLKPGQWSRWMMHVDFEAL